MEVFNVTAISPIQDAAGLYISDITIPKSPELLREHGITHVVSLTNQRQCPKFGPDSGLHHLHIDIEDNPFEDLIMSLEGICAWIQNALSANAPSAKPVSNGSRETTQDKLTLSDGDASRREPKVLVHCVQGMSRSGAVIVAYLMYTLSIDYDSALTIARKSRAVIMPNSGFADQLRLWSQMGLSIYADSDMDSEGSERRTKAEYENWKSNRGVLLSKGQEEKQKIAMKSMADMAARFGKRRLELKAKTDGSNAEESKDNATPVGSIQL